MIEIRIGKICSPPFRRKWWTRELIGLSRDKSSAFRKCTVAFAILARAWWKTFAITIAHSSDVYWKPYLFIFPRAFHLLPLHNRPFCSSFEFVLSLFHIFLSLISIGFNMIEAFFSAVVKMLQTLLSTTDSLPDFCLNEIWLADIFLQNFLNWISAKADCALLRN